MFSICKKGSLSSLKGKKGQFTIFVIIGLVIFFAFAFALYARVKIINAQFAGQADLQLKDYLNKNSLNQYVTSCLDAVADDIFIRATMQGGTFNFTDKTEYVDYIEYYDETYNKTFNISIIIDANNRCPDGRLPTDYYIVTQTPYLYPFNCRNEYVRNLPAIYTRYIPLDPCRNNCTDKNFRAYSGFFGINALPVICDVNGANARGDTNLGSVLSCDYYEEFNISMQQLLEEEITKDINKCVNFTEILQKTPSNISQVGNVTATVIFKRGGLIIRLQYPFTIIMRNRQPVTRIADFSVERNLPFKELYEYTYELANNDVKDVRFDIFKSMENVIGGKNNLLRRDQNIYQSNFFVKLIYGTSANQFINVVQVVDNTSKIRGLPLTITFAIKNRRPALDYIHGDNPKYDLAAVEEQTLTLSPKGYDPDDELSLMYNYEGWREDYLEYYNWSDPNCSFPSSFDYVLENCTIQNETIAMHNWTRSYDYIATHQNASYNTTHDDIGLHVVKISVLDRAGLDDYQDVRILVFDLPQAKINGSNMFEDVPDNLASYEDLYILNGSESTVGAIAATIGNVFFTRFFWNDSTEPFTVDKNINAPGDMAIYVPFGAYEPELSWDSINIMNITDYRFVNKSESSTIHEIFLTVTNSIGLFNDNKFLLNVTRCVNHTSENNIPSYPFDILYSVAVDNLTGHLMANHTCCSDEMDYRDEDSVCYAVTNYGANISFRDYGVLPDTADYQITYEGQSGGSLTSGYDNDIFMQIFTSYCSGTRGNTCTGDIEEKRKVFEECEDNNYIVESAFHNERCSGPPDTYFSPNSARDTTTSCTNYSAGTTFESLSGSGTGTCTTNKQCSDGTNFWEYNNVISPYSCHGQCNSDGTCNFADQSTCTCDTGCNSLTGAQVHVACQGVSYPGDGTPLAPNSRTCDLAPSGESYFEDTCSNCGLVDKDQICVAPSMTINGCTADPSCDGVNAGTTFNGVSSRCIASTSQAAMCDNGCDFVPAMDARCRTVGIGCIGDPSCNTRTRNTQLPGSTTTTDYCNNACQIDQCKKGHTYSSINQMCNNDCTAVMPRCIAGYTCCTGAGCPIGINVGDCYQ